MDEDSGSDIEIVATTKLPKVIKLESVDPIEIDSDKENSNPERHA